MLKNTILLLVFSFFLLPLKAQSLSDDSGSAGSSAKIVGLYQEKVAGQSPLYQGREYLGFDNRIIGHAFFASDEWSQATIQYDGVLYEGVRLLFDIVNEEVIVLHPNDYAKIKLLNEQISWFSFSGHTFIRLAGNEAVPEAGLYERLYDGKLMVLAKRKKQLSSYTSDKELIREFEEKNRLYIKKEGIYHAVKSKRSVLKVLKEQKKELRRFLRKNKIKYRKNRDAAIVKMAGFYDSLEN